MTVRLIPQLYYLHGQMPPGKVKETTVLIKSVKKSTYRNMHDLLNQTEKSKTDAVITLNGVCL